MRHYYDDPADEYEDYCDEHDYEDHYAEYDYEDYDDGSDCVVEHDYSQDPITGPF